MIESLLEDFFKQLSVQKKIRIGADYFLLTRIWTESEPNLLNLTKYYFFLTVSVHIILRF